MLFQNKFRVVVSRDIVVWAPQDMGLWSLDPLIIGPHMKNLTLSAQLRHVMDCKIDWLLKDNILQKNPVPTLLLTSSLIIQFIISVFIIVWYMISIFILMNFLCSLV